MNKALLIFRHEFRQTIKRVGFIALTIIPPLIALLGIGVYHVISGVARPPSEAVSIGYVDEAGGFTGFTDQDNMTLVLFDNEATAKQALLAGSIKEYFVIPSDFVASGVIRRYTTQRELTPPAATQAAINHFISSNLLTGEVPESTIVRIETPLSLVTTTLTETGEVAPDQGGLANFIIPATFSMLLALSLIFSSNYLLRSLSEEKENRLMEILLSSVSTRQLLAGKLLGLGAAGLVQVIVWGWPSPPC
jgi:ABC-2 type transport system permease protein